VTFLIVLALAPFIVLTFCLVVELFMGLRPLRLPQCPRGLAVAAVIVVPAHDEAASLKLRLTALSKAARGRADILLVADNCTDRTAEIARNAGVETIERVDPERRGKGFALDFARQHLRRNPPEVVIVVDADCAIDGQSLNILIARCVAGGNPQQATNLQAPAPDASPAVQLSTFAFFIKNVVRQRALQRITGRVNLLGTGMALPWSAFVGAELATSNIVEDLKLGQELAEAGHGPQFAEDAAVWSAAESDANTLSQRHRWEGGFLRNALLVAPGFLLRSLRRRDGAGTWGAVNLMIPPFALLILIDLIALVAAGSGTWATGAAAWPLFLLGGLLLLAGAGLILAWAAGGSRFVSARSLAQAPLYLLWKAPMYIRFVRRGAPKEWLRTGRDGN